MKKALFITLTFVLALVPTFAHALETLDPARLGVIQQRCTVLQTGLDQLQRRDLVARTNRGREYENVITQLDALAQRLHNNNIATPTLDVPENEFKNDVNAFRDAYVLYDNSMNVTKNIDCRNKPADFATALEQSRVLRAEVGAAVTKGEDALIAYRQAVVELQATLPAPLTGGTQ
jgi:hypothetical protein